MLPSYLAGRAMIIPPTPSCFSNLSFHKLKCFLDASSLYLSQFFVCLVFSWPEIPSESSTRENVARVASKWETGVTFISKTHGQRRVPGGVRDDPERIPVQRGGYR